MTSDQKFYLDLIKDKPIAFGIENGFTDLKEINNEWIKLFIHSKEDVTLQGHRGSYKTTCLSIAIALIMTVKPLETIMFLRKSDDDVKEIVVQVAKLLKSDIFRDMVKSLWGVDLILTKV